MTTDTRTRDPLTPARVENVLEKNGIDLTHKQFLMLWYFLQGHSKASACEQAGLAQSGAPTLFASPRIQRAIAVVLERFLTVDAAPAALRCLYTIVQDEKAAPGVRVTAANSLLDRAGFDAKRLAKPEKGDADISTMTADELRAEIARLEQEQDSRMKDVTGNAEPVSEPTDSQLSDFP